MDSLWTATLACRDCGYVLNTAENIPAKQKDRVALTGGFAAGKCPNGCRTTFSDLNLNTTLTWTEQHDDLQV